MAGHRSFDELRECFSPERRAANSEATKAALSEMASQQSTEAPRQSLSWNRTAMSGTHPSKEKE
jgi:hypothetical protein